MYYIKNLISNEIIYQPGADGTSGNNITLTETLNDAGQLVFTIPNTNNCYNELVEGYTKIALCENTDIIWRGFVESTRVNFRQEKTVTCIGELSYLSRSIQGQSYNNRTSQSLLNKLITNHNNQSDEQFNVGIVSTVDTGTQIHYTDFNTTLDCIRDKVCDGYDGYIKIRWENDTRYIDILTLDEYGATSTQPIQFGYNLMDYVKNKSTLDIYSQVYPKGARLDTQKVTNLDAYVTIETENNNIPYVENQDLINAVGKKMTVVSWDDVTTPSQLKTKAVNWLNNQQLENIQLELKAVDISGITNFDTFKVGDKVNVLCPHFDLNLTLPIMSKTTNIQDPSQNMITVGNGISLSYTQMNSAKSGAVLKTNDAWSGGVSVGGLTVGGNPLDDFVVEQGTSSGWTYRKWSNGFCELWKTVATGALSWSATGNVFYSNEILYNVPSFLSDVKGVQFTPRNVSVLGCTQTITTVTGNQLGFRVHRSTQGTASININIAIQGTWQ